MSAERAGVLFNQRGGTGHRVTVALISAFLMAIVFVIDTFTEIEGAIAVLYVMALLLGSEILTRTGLLLTSIVCIFLTVLSYFLTHGPDPDLQTFIRLAVALAALAITMALLLRNDAFRAELIERNAEIRESEARYRSIFDGARVALWERDYSRLHAYLSELKAAGVTDLEDHARRHPEIIDHCIGLLRTVAANEAARELVGTSANSGSRESMADFIASGDKTFLHLMNAMFTGQPYFEGKGRITTDSGEIRQVLLSISFPEDTAAFNRVVVGMVDITQREMTEAALVEARAEFAKASKAATIGALSASLAHELNQPLGAIAVNAQTLIRWLDRDPPDLSAIRRSAERIIRDGQRASDIIHNTRNLLTQQESKAEWIDLSTLIDETRSLVEHDLKRDGIAVTVRPGEGVPQVKSVRVEIQQVMINLMTNAIQAINGAKCPVREIIVEIQPADGMVGVSVRDSGPGISPEGMEKLFTPFYTTKAEGLGMGLSICRSTLESRGGKLDGFNHPDGGAVFKMTLPIEDPHL
ncbi:MULTISPECIES: PAS domain-containing sensor histidine kinase [unclassified Rhizobium]|uniref:PAS domain-containing sensor histidine kinase n=1 Tax=unclassified Rhizobium TaxID=2613769 RepID=UPI00185D323B|nr:ATP-binding protein [Rhizobium sp. UBA1881]